MEWRITASKVVKVTELIRRGRPGRYKVLTLDIKEDRLLPGSIVVLCPDYVLSTVLELDTVDNKGVVLA